MLLLDQLHNVSRWRRETGRIGRHEVRTFPYGIGFGIGFVPLSFAETTGGGIWVGSAYGGLSRFKDERWTFFDDQRGAPAGRIQSLLRDRRGRLWIGSTSGGLARLDRPDEDQPVFVPIRKANGLSSDTVLALTEDLDGFIYVGTGLGVDRLDPDTFAVRRYGVEDGLPGGPVVSAIRDPMGDLWFGTRQGLSRFTPSTVLQTTLAQAGAERILDEEYSLRRIEAGLPAGGAELTEDYTPLEAGWLRPSPAPKAAIPARK